MNEKNNFSGKIGFIMAAAGASVGLGNLWRFPYLAAQYGGGLFVCLYILLIITLGSVLMTTEISLGRLTQHNVFNCYKTLDKRFTFLGVMGLVIPFFVMCSYGVIGGWILKYLFRFLLGQGTLLASETYFSESISQTLSPLIHQALFIVLSLGILLAGVKNGIEKSNKVLMPLLLLLSVIIAVKAVLLPGGLSGIAFYLVPDFSHFSLKTVLAAIGQVFYSLSLSMGVMVTYGSYLNRDIEIPQSVKMTELFDTVIALLGGMMIVPAVFAFSGGDRNAISAGSGLLFETLPRIFHQMSFGNLFGALFFLLILFAALTSMIALMEVPVAFLTEKRNMKRHNAVFLTVGIVFLTGIPASLGFGTWSHIQLFGMGIFDFIDYIANTVLLPLIAIFSCIFVGYFLGTERIFEEVEHSSPFRHKKYYTVMIKYIVPICLGAVWLSGVFSF